MIRDLTPDDIEFFPIYILPHTQDATEAQIAKTSAKVDKGIKTLIERSKQFSDYMMIGKGMFFNRSEDTISFQSIYALPFPDLEWDLGIYLSISKKEQEQLGIKSKCYLIIHFYSDKETNHLVEAANRAQNKDLTLGLTHYYFDETIRKQLLMPTAFKTTRKPTTKRSEKLQTVLSDLSIEDLEVINRSIDHLLKKFIQTKNSKHLV